MLTTCLMLATVVAYVESHGRLMEPPNRASIWRFGYDSPANYDDDGMNCGGFYRQWSVNKGKCGICGDAYDEAQPRAHELGGLYGRGHIVANYEAGQIITTKVDLTASHLGFWELRICPHPYNQRQECFDNGYLLELEEGGTKFYPRKGDATYKVNFRLPEDLTCEHCVLQWQYTAGNNWGVCANGTQGLGCGNQEQFYSCSDISITNSDSNDILDDVSDNYVVSTTVKEPTSLSPLLACLGSSYEAANDIEVQLLLRRIELSGYRIFCGNTPVTSNSHPKKHINKHRRKKNNRKSKRHKKVFFWR